MTNDKKQYVFYEYLKFFYRKKWLFLLLPIIGLVIGAMFSMIQERQYEYEGEALVYLGGVDNQSFVDGDIIEANYTPEGDVDISGRNNV